MSKKKLLASAPTKEDLTKLINEFYCSKNYTITEDNKIYNDKFTEERLNRINSEMVVRFYRNRWRFEMIVNN